MKKFKVVVNGEPYEVEVEELASTPPLVVHASPAAPTAPAPAKVVAAQEAVKPQAAPVKPKAQAVQGAGAVTAPMPGNINDVKVAVGDQINAGDGLLILEAMKMENEIAAPMAGTVKEVHVKKGQTVQNGDLLVVIA